MAWASLVVGAGTDVAAFGIVMATLNALPAGGESEESANYREFLPEPFGDVNRRAGRRAMSRLREEQKARPAAAEAQNEGVPQCESN